jgi:F-type H+-transporting ATPase subunit epsilon
MSAELFNLKVFTPAGLVFEDKASSVTMISQNGEIGVLPQHIKYNGLLGTGVFQYIQASASKAKRLVVSEGFATFNDDELVILADYVLLPEDINTETYAKDRASLQAKVDTLSALDPEWQTSRDALSLIEAIDLLAAH